MRRHRFRSALTAATLVAALGLAGCSNHEANNSPSAAPPAPAATSSTPIAAPTAPLPAPDALIDVLTRLSDLAVPGTDKVGLVQEASPDSAAVLDKYTNALRDNGYLPMTFTADRIAWSDKTPSIVTATINVVAANNRRFTFPMDFTPNQGGWQLSHKTAEMLLALGNSTGTSAGTEPPASSPAQPPPPPPPPPPSPAPPVPSR